MQNYARSNKVSIDQVDFAFTMLTIKPGDGTPAPEDGDWPLPHLLRPRVARHREAMESMRRTYRCP